MINYLIRLATHLDTTGLHREAAYLDSMIKRAANQDEVGPPILPMPPDADTVAGSHILVPSHPWTHIAATFELGASTGGDGKVYINGALDNTASLSSITKTNWNL